jgi:hypothetical protein
MRGGGKGVVSEEGFLDFFAVLVKTSLLRGFFFARARRAVMFHYPFALAPK